MHAANNEVEHAPTSNRAQPCDHVKQWCLATVMRGNVNYEKQCGGIEATY